MDKFEEFNLSRELQESIKKLGIKVPTEIQTQSIPLIMEGKDVIAESATGSGKTLAFGCGLIEKVKPIKELQAIVLTPTRELTEQVKDSLMKLSYKKALNILAIYGGVSIEHQIRDLKRTDIVVATPGRFLDHLSRRTIDTSKVKILVLDEADRMLDMGFIDDVEKIVRVCPKNRQTLFFSATISSEIRKLANKYMNNPVKVAVQRLVDPSKLKQVYYNVDQKMKLSLLIHLLKKEKLKLVMVFCNSRKNVDFVVENLILNDINAISIHGGLNQNKRSKTMETFNKSKSAVLVCTNVAGRGLHVDDISHVYNYDIPKDPKDYVHRIGRTARAGKEGRVINLLCEFDHDNFRRLLHEYREFSIELIKTPFIKKVKFVNPSPKHKRPFNSRRTSFRQNRRF